MLRATLTLLASATVLMMPVSAWAEEQFTAKALVSAIEAQLEQKENMGDISVNLLGDYPEVIYRHANPMTVSLTVENIDTARGLFTVAAELKETANPSGPSIGKRFVVNGRYEEMVELPVATRRITGKEPITQADLTWASFPKRRILRETATSMEDLIGKAPRRSIAQGRPIAGDDVMQPLVVRKNDPITMTYENKMLRITANGVATQDGAVGERIGIRNATSQTTIYGVVTGPGAIVVKGRETTSITQNNISATPAGGNHELR